MTTSKQRLQAYVEQALFNAFEAERNSWGGLSQSQALERILSERYAATEVLSESQPVQSSTNLNYLEAKLSGHEAITTAQFEQIFRRLTELEVLVKDKSLSESLSDSLNDSSIVNSELSSELSSESLTSDSELSSESLVNNSELPSKSSISNSELSSELPSELLVDDSELPSELPSELSISNSELPSELLVDDSELLSESLASNGELPSELPSESSISNSELPSELLVDDSELLSESLASNGELPSELPSESSISNSELNSELLASNGELSSGSLIDPDSSYVICLANLNSSPDNLQYFGGSGRKKEFHLTLKFAKIYKSWNVAQNQLDKLVASGKYPSEAGWQIGIKYLASVNKGK